MPRLSEVEQIVFLLSTIFSNTINTQNKSFFTPTATGSATAGRVEQWSIEETREMMANGD